MSEEAPLPPKVQQRLLHFQQLYQQVQNLVARKQQLKLELMEVENALRELEKVGEDTPVYKSVGAILIRTDKAKLVQELEDRKTFLNLRIEQVEREEKRARELLEDVRAKLRKEGVMV